MAKLSSKTKIEPSKKVRVTLTMTVDTQLSTFETWDNDTDLYVNPKNAEGVVDVIQNGSSSDPLIELIYERELFIDTSNVVWELEVTDLG